MATIAELLVRIGADPGKFIAGIDSASQSFENFLFRVDQSSQALRSLGLASSAAGTAVLAFLGVAVAAASEAQRQQFLLAQAIEATGRAADFSVEALQRQQRALELITPFSDEAVASVQRLLVGFGLTQQEIESLTPRILDLAARLGVDVTTSALAVGRAFTFGVTSLRRLGVAIDANISPIQDFDAFLAALDKSAGGAAEAAGRTLPGALAKLKNQVDNLLEAIGAPLLGPLTALAGAAAKVAVLVRQAAEAFPHATQAIVFLSVALGVLLLGAGGVALLLSLLPKALQLTNAWSGAMGVLFGTVARATSGLRAFAFEVAAVSKQMGLLPGATVAVAGVLRALPGLMGLATVAARALGVALRGIAGGIVGIVLFEVAFRVLEAAIRAAWNVLRPFLERLGFLAPSQEEAAHAVAALDAALKRQGLTLEQVKADYDEARAATELFEKATRRAAAESARLKLLQPGIDEAGVKAALERLDQDQRDAAQTAAEQSLRVEQRRLERLEAIQAGFVRRRQAGLITDVDAERQVAEQILDARKGIAAAEETISAARLAAVRQEAEAVAKAAKEEAAARLDAERLATQAAVDFAKARIAAQADEAKQIEKTRIDALRRVADLESSLTGEVVAAREALFRAQSAREDALLRVRAAERARQVREGFLTETEAEQAAQQDRFNVQRAEIEREIELRRSRLAAAQRQADLELAVAAAQFRAEQAMRQADLQAAVIIGRAETAAKVAELKAQLAARVAELDAELQARQAAGLASAEEVQARERQIRAITAGTQAQIAALLEGEAQKEQALAQASVASRQAAELELAATVQDVQGKLAQAQAEGAAGLVDQTETLRALIAERREELRSQGVSEAEIDRQLAPATSLLDRATRGTKEATDVATESLGRVQAALEKIAEALTNALRPLAEAVQSLLNPDALLAALGRIQAAVPVPPGAPPAVAAAAAAAQPVAGAPTLVMQLGNAELRLEGDRAALVASTLAALFGPEGQALVEDFFKRTPGPRQGP